MNIKVDTSFIPDYLDQFIRDSTEIKKFYIKEYQLNGQDNTKKKTSVFEFPGTLNEFKEFLNIQLKKNSMNEYIVTEDTENVDSLAVLKVGDIEQLGILVCNFCGAVFGSEDEKYIHQRAHYFF